MTTHVSGFRGAAPMGRVADSLRAALRALGRASRAQARLDRLRRLSALDDEALARRGLSREGLVRHVFADALWD
ncbi:DUF1127 domain-containing protein [Roseibacterium sp. SDUM158017]|uniref:DUF1127 domain-containing protein n=1 Tax=Roseicyclus salinarum TaxID=3036773 RepID=UPI002414D2E9|nr:DUF1127 domain-containing protein [Roseibacterium sp. SDUM158017]MDG4648547.1 DUF1127 domain-containing protein [Roseibacterium sp. SDUM158017]